MTLANGQRVRVWVTDVWDSIWLRVTPKWTVGRVKVEALRAATGREPDADEYSVKFRGAAVVDEQVTLGSLGAGDGAGLIVLPARRRPVR